MNAKKCYTGKLKSMSWAYTGVTFDIFQGCSLQVPGKLLIPLSECEWSGSQYIENRCVCVCIPGALGTKPVHILTNIIIPVATRTLKYSCTRHVLNRVPVILERECKEYQ